MNDAVDPAVRQAGLIKTLEEFRDELTEMEAEMVRNYQTVCSRERELQGNIRLYLTHMPHCADRTRQHKAALFALQEIRRSRSKIAREMERGRELLVSVEADLEALISGAAA